MKIDNLHVGLVVKDYPTLCKILEIPKKRGNPQTAQIKELERYIKYRKEGRNFIIEEIFETIKEKDDKRINGGNSAPYSKDAELLLIDLLLCGKGELMMPNTALLKALQFVNHNYSFYFGDNRPLLADGLKIDLNLVNDYYSNVNSSLVGNIKTIIDRLEKKKLLIHKEVIMVKVVEEASKSHNLNGGIKLDINTEIDENGIEHITYKPAQVKTKEVYREASVDELRAILRIQREVMIELGFNKEDKYNVLYRNGMTFKFNKIVNDRLLRELNILRSFKSHHLIFNNDHLEDERLYLIEGIEKELMKSSINLEVRKRIIKNAKNRAKEASATLLNELYKNTNDVQLDNFHSNTSALYIEHYELLNNFLIDTKYNNKSDSQMFVNNREEIEEVLIELPELM